MKKEFTIEQGLVIQTENLKFYETILKKEYYDKLVLRVIKEQQNNPAKDGYDVIRGSSISCMVQNILLED
jgi:hypothetical protein